MQRLLTHSLTLQRERGDGRVVARILRHLSDANRLTDLPEEEIQQAKEALNIYKQLGNTVEQVNCLIKLAWLLCWNKQLDAAEEAGSHAIDLLPKKGNQFLVCESHCILGEIYRSKGEAEKTFHRYELALGIVSPFN